MWVVLHVAMALTIIVCIVALWNQDGVHEVRVCYGYIDFLPAAMQLVPHTGNWLDGVL